MVSLSRNTNLTAGGATFFGDSVGTDDREHLQPHLESYKIFKPLTTTPLISLHLLATLTLEITAIVLASLHPDEQSKCRSYFVLLYIHVSLWFLTLFIDCFVKKKHHELRLNGYLEFYKKTYTHHRLPLYIVSLWNCVILLLQTLMQHFYADDFAEQCVRKDLFTPLNYICAIITLEVCVLFGISTSYIVKVRKFNKQRSLPDVQKEEWAACSTNEGFTEGEIGYRQQGDRTRDFIEKQADLIRYLKEHNNRLSEKIMILNAQMQARGRVTTA